MRNAGLWGVCTVLSALLAWGAVSFLGPFPRSAQAHTMSPTSALTFYSGQTLTASALNDAFGHIHNTFSGGITDSMVSTSAAIQHSKLQRPALVAKAWVFAEGCTTPGATCTRYANSQVTSITRDLAVAGRYKIQLGYTPTDAFFAPVPQSTSAQKWCVSNTFQTVTPHFQVECYDHAGTASDSPFTVVVHDDN